MTLELRVFAHSEIGLVRKNNQDSGYASPTMLMVADGMGGAAAGDLASRIAIDELRGVDGQGQGDEMLDILDDATRRANDRLAAMIENDPELDGMGTTICGGLFDGADLGLVHIGDSRAYLMRGDLMIRLTHDHSWVQSLMDEGKLTGPQAFSHPHRSLLLRVLNGQPYSRPDLLRVGLKDCDRVMICSDGLCGLVDDPAIARGLALSDPQDALERLIQVAHRAGGSDNITIIVADVFEVAPVAGSPAAGPGAETAGAAAGAAAPSASPAATLSGAPLTPTSPATPVGSDSPAGPTGPTVPADGAARSGLTARLGPDTLISSTPATAFAPLTALLTSPSAPDDGPASAGGPASSARSAGPAGSDSPTSPSSPATPTSPSTPVNPSSHPAPTAPPPRRPAQLRAALLAGDPVQAKGRRVGRGVLIGAAAQIAPLDGPQAVLTGPTALVRSSAPPGRSQRPRRRRRWGLIVGLTVVLLALVAAVLAGFHYGRSQYFVSTADQRVAIYQGLPGDVLGLSTNRLFETTEIELTDLPLRSREDVSAGIVIRQGGLTQARLTVAELRALSHECLQRRAQRQDSVDPGPGAAQNPDDGC
jgi:serine/threonine protein phosphatase PrpC